MSTKNTKEKNNNTLYELTGKYLELLNHCEKVETEDDLKAVQDTFESLDVVINDKLEGCSKVIKELEGKVQMLKDEEERLASRRKNITNSMENLKSYMMDNMKKLEIDKVDTGLFRISVAKNGGMRKLKFKVDADKLPEAARVVEYKPDTKAIREMIKKNDTLAETDWWKLEPQGEHLSIR